MNWRNGQCGIKGLIINVPVEMDQILKQLPRNIDDQRFVFVNIKRRMFAKTVYLADEVSREVLLPWVEVLRDSPLYRHYGTDINVAKLETLCNDAVFEGSTEYEVVMEESEDLVYLSEPPAEGVALTLDQHAMVYDEDFTLTIAPCEGKRPAIILYDAHAEELSFPQIYLGHARNICLAAKPTPFMMASSEIRRGDRRGALPMHVLYMAMKIIRHRVCGHMNVMFRNK
ncbi:hypothetical protein V5799_020165, partial [Amblyomma americanum]